MAPIRAGAIPTHKCEFFLNILYSIFPQLFIDSHGWPFDRCGKNLRFTHRSQPGW